MADNESRNGPFVTLLATLFLVFAVIGMGIVTGWLIGDRRGALFGGVFAALGLLGCFGEVAFLWLLEVVLWIFQPGFRALNRRGLNPELEEVTIPSQIRRILSATLLIVGVVTFIWIFQKW